MKNRPITAVAMCLVMFIMLYAPAADTSPDISQAASAVKLSAKSMSLRAGKSKVLSMKNTTRSVTWKIKSGKTYIRLKNKKARKVTIVGKKKGNAVVTGTITYSSRNKKTYSCKVKVLKAQWTCPYCGAKNTGNYCTNCGRPKPTETPHGNVTPTPTPTATPTPTPDTEPTASASVSPSPTPATGPDELSDRNILLILNDSYYFWVQMYANASATAFYNQIQAATKAGKTYGLSMPPIGDNERYAYLPTPIETCVSSSCHVLAGELYLYSGEVLKLACTAHDASANPTRIGKIVNPDTGVCDEAVLAKALKADKEDKTSAVFKLNW